MSDYDVVLLAGPGEITAHKPTMKEIVAYMRRLSRLYVIEVETPDWVLFVRNGTQVGMLIKKKP